MQAVNVPALLPLVWAADADPAYVRNIPTNSQIGVTNGAASLHDGFPPLTMTSKGSGGVPPFGQDTNGILRWLTQIAQWGQAGGPSRFDGTFATAIGGYPKGAVLQSSTLNGVVWRSTADNNTTDPDSVSAANWVSFFAPVFANPTFSGTATFNGPAIFGSTVNLGTSASATTQAQNSNDLKVATDQYVDRQAATTLASAAGDATAKANAALGSAQAYARGLVDGFSAPSAGFQQLFGSAGTGNTAQAVIVTAVNGVLVVSGARNNSDVSPSSDLAQLLVNGVSLQQDSTKLSTAHMVAERVGPGTYVCEYAAGANVSFSVQVAASFTPDPPVY